MVGWGSRPISLGPAAYDGSCDSGRIRSGADMATYEKAKPPENIPDDLLPVISESGVLTARQFEEVRAKVDRGEYPRESVALAERLVADRVLTDYQTRRFLNNKAYGLVVGRYVVL